MFLASETYVHSVLILGSFLEGFSPGCPSLGGMADSGLVGLAGCWHGWLFGCALPWLASWLAG